MAEIKVAKITKLYNLVQYFSPPGFTITNGSNKVTKVATLLWNSPYALAKFKKRVEEGNKAHPKGTFFKIEENIKPQTNGTNNNNKSSN